MGTLVLSWLLVYACIFKGVKTSGKAVYFTALFPYVMLAVLFVRGVTLKGAFKGLEFYMKPDFERLLDSRVINEMLELPYLNEVPQCKFYFQKVWVDAGTQVFFSYAATFGGMVALGSYNRYHRDFMRDCALIAGVNCFSSLFAGCVIFSVLGFMSETSGLPVAEVVDSGELSFKAKIYDIHNGFFSFQDLD